MIYKLILTSSNGGHDDTTPTIYYDIRYPRFIRPPVPARHPVPPLQRPIVSQFKSAIDTAILRTCQQVYEEALPYLYSLNRLAISLNTFCLFRPMRDRLPLFLRSEPGVSLLTAMRINVTLEDVEILVHHYSYLAFAIGEYENVNWFRYSLPAMKNLEKLQVILTYQEDPLQTWAPRLQTRKEIQTLQGEYYYSVLEPFVMALPRNVSNNAVWGLTEADRTSTEFRDSVPRTVDPQILRKVVSRIRAAKGRCDGLEDIHTIFD
jgi:hypothetical protein